MPVAETGRGFEGNFYFKGTMHDAAWYQRGTKMPSRDCKGAVAEPAFPPL